MHIEERMHDGHEILATHLKKIAKEAELFLAAIKGFHRDLSLSMQATVRFTAEFLSTPHGLAVPPHASTDNFSDLAQFFLLADGSLDGSIKLKHLPPGPMDSEKEKLLEEADMTHKNLVTVSEAAQHLYESLRLALSDFEQFNTKNIEVGAPEANIFFDRDALTLAMERARGLGERAVRVDIDLMESAERVRTSIPYATV